MPAARVWETSLGAIAVAVGDCLKSLDRYEAAFQTAYSERGGPVEALRIHVPYESIDEAWDEHLAGADRSAADVEQLLAEQEIVWARWQELVASWRQSLEQTPELTPEISRVEFRRDPPRRRAV